ncbi:MAG: CRISPR-associated helicase Cas3' [Bacteroidota bacterium]|nr:CRISPR-associated helicase Cas3' [Bacteroidota bacterium]
MVTFSEIRNREECDVSNILKDANKYYAHWNDNQKETLRDHTNLTVDYFLRLCEVNGLEPIIDQMVAEICKANLDSYMENSVSFLKSLFIKSILYHDLGKMNENFQIVKMENEQFNRVKNGIGSDHSFLSAYLFIATAFKELEESSFCQSDKALLFLLVFLFAHPIVKHHGEISNPEKVEFEEDMIASLSGYLNLLNTTDGVNGDHFKNILEKKDQVFGLLNNTKSFFHLYTLIKLNSSLLTASDYYATNEFMLKIKCDDFGIIDDELRKKLYEGVYSISYNHDLLEKKDNYKRESFENLQSISNENLNVLRQKLSCEVLSNLERNKTKRLFYIEAPTGSGKTNLSVLCLAELLKSRKDATKVFYVFPFTTLITQTAKFIRENLRLEQDELAEIHSKAPYHDNRDGEDYGTKRKNYLDNLFVNYPISLISHIRFFDILTSNEKEVNYLLHRVANSIVIIDEIQSYTPSEWDKINYLLNSYSESFNITFIVMSATLPKISKLLLNKDGEQKDNFVYLVENKDNYFQNPNFRNRVVFNFDYINSDEYSSENLLSIIYEHSEAYYKKEKRVKAIVEFVTKISAQDFYEKLNADSRFLEYKKFIVSGTVLEPRRKEIIDYLKSDESNFGKIVVACTQVVEAGLDIDMDIGFKDKSIVDAEEQLAGRINRNASKKNAELVLFNSRDSLKTYKSDLRHKQHIDLESYKNILIKKDFDSFYDKVFENINRDNKDQNMVGNLSDFQNQIKRLDFQEVHKQFELIKGSTVSIFVPLAIGTCHFSEGELRFLQSAKVIGEGENKVGGERVWELYISVIENRDIDFISKKIDLKILSPILAKFSFSVWNNKNQFGLLKHYSDGNEFKYGFLYLQYYVGIYSYEDGLKRDIETDCNFL